MSLRVRFDATLQTVSDNGEFPPDTIRRVYVVNRDGCTYGAVDVDKDGRMTVDVDMAATRPDVCLTDRVKLHFYFHDMDQQLKPVCAGHMPLMDLAGMIGDGGAVIFKSNFTSNRVTMHIEANEAHSIEMHKDLLALYENKLIVPSVLNDSPRFNTYFEQLGNSISDGLQSHTSVRSVNGGTMFQGLRTAHVMEGEQTLYTLYHMDFNEAEKMPPPLCVYGLIETMQFLGITVEQLRKLSRTQLTDFLAAYATFPMRSASAVPYTPDKTMTEDPRQYNTNRSKLSELFKRPYSHPYNGKPGQLHGCLLTDDCEGLALIPQTLTHHLV